LWIIRKHPGKLSPFIKSKKFEERNRTWKGTQMTPRCSNYSGQAQMEQMNPPKRRRAGSDFFEGKSKNEKTLRKLYYKKRFTTKYTKKLERKLKLKN
jgi:hypothetical protein